MNETPNMENPGQAPSAGNTPIVGPSNQGGTQGSIFARIREQVKSRLPEVTVKRRGRHPADCQCEKCVARRASATAKPDQTVSVAGVAASDGSPVDAKLVETCVAQTLAVIDDITTDAIYRNAVKITEDRNLAKQFAERVHIKDVEKTGMSKLSGQVCVQYGVHGEHAALVMLGIMTTNITLRTFVVVNALRKMAEDKARILKEQATKQ